MIYKLGNISDLSALPALNQDLEHHLTVFLQALTAEYGADRDVDHDDGGYVLYATEGSKVTEIIPYIDVLHAIPEWVTPIQSLPPCCAALYLTSNEYAVTVLMATADAPENIIKELER